MADRRGVGWTSGSAVKVELVEEVTIKKDPDAAVGSKVQEVIETIKLEPVGDSDDEATAPSSSSLPEIPSAPSCGELNAPGENGVFDESVETSCLDYASSSSESESSDAAVKKELVEVISITKPKKQLDFDQDCSSAQGVIETIKVESDSEEDATAPASSALILDATSQAESSGADSSGLDDESSESDSGCSDENITNLKGEGCSLYIQNRDMSDALLAVWNDDLNALKAAVENNLHVGNVSHPAATLQLALKLQRSPEMIRELLKGEGRKMVNMELRPGFGAKPVKVVARKSTGGSPFRWYRLPLDEAIRSTDEERSLELVRLLLEHGADPKKGPVNTLTVAVEMEHLRVLRLLLQNGADVNLRRFRRPKPIETAIETKKWDALDILLELGTDLARALETPLWSATCCGDLPLMKLLLQRGADARRGAPIMAAIGTENVDAVKLLLEFGASVNATGYRNRTPLHLAVEEDVMLEFLLQNGARTEATNDDQLTPMQLAAQQGKVEMMKTLMSHSTESDESILQIEFDNLEVIRLLLDRFPRHPGHKFNLFRFIRRGDLELVRLYLEAGVELSPEEGEEQIERINLCFFSLDRPKPRTAQWNVSPEGKTMIGLINEFVPFGPAMKRPKLRRNAARRWPST